MEFYYRRKGNGNIPQGAVAVYVYNTLATGNDDFKNLTEKIPMPFESNPKEFRPFIFSGININKIETFYFAEREHYAKSLEPLKNNACFNDFRALRHKLSWLTHTRPELLAAVNILSQITEETLTPENIKSMNRTIKHIKDYPSE